MLRRTAALGVLAALPVVLSAGPGLGGAAAAPLKPVGVAPNVGVRNASSLNWAGYAAVGGRRYTSVSAGWTAPAVSCTSQNTYSSFWVGLDGANSSTVEQTGSAAECHSGRPVYYAWYEMYPQAPRQVDTVRPGDRMSASVTTNGSGSFTLTIRDATRGWSHTIHASLASAKLSSAEVIAEAPASAQTGNVLPLAKFGTVHFTGATANGATFGALRATKINMVTQSGQLKASTSALSGGTAFGVTWHHS